MTSRETIFKDALEYIDRYEAIQQGTKVASEDMPSSDTYGSDGNDNGKDGEDLEIKVKGIEITRNIEYKRLVCTTLKKMGGDLKNSKAIVDTLISTLITGAIGTATVVILGVSIPTVSIGPILGYVAILTTEVIIEDLCKDFNN